MSLFEDFRYVYRDTFFIFFLKKNCPLLNDFEACIESLGDKFDLQNIKHSIKNDQKRLESGTIVSPQDRSAMDVVYVEGPEVQEQVAQIFQEFRSVTLTGDDRQNLERLTHCDARFDIFHFAEVTEGVDEDEILDPGGLLLVMSSLAELTGGVSFDPQSQDLN